VIALALAATWLLRRQRAAAGRRHG
jgi:hypothetical protein